MTQFLTGMYDGKIDDKGRLSLPARLRTALGTQQVVILPGLDENHLMLMTPDYFENQFCKQILSTPLALMDREKRQLVRKLISPAQYVDVDSAGRISIPSVHALPLISSRNQRHSWSEQAMQSKSGIPKLTKKRRVRTMCQSASLLRRFMTGRADKDGVSALSRHAQ